MNRTEPNRRLQRARESKRGSLPPLGMTDRQTPAVDEGVEDEVTAEKWKKIKHIQRRSDAMQPAWRESGDSAAWTGSSHDPPGGILSLNASSLWRAPKGLQTVSFFAVQLSGCYEYAFHSRPRGPGPHPSAAWPHPPGLCQASALIGRPSTLHYSAAPFSLPRTQMALSSRCGGGVYVA